METPALTFAFPYPLWLVPIVVPLSWRLYRWAARERRERLEAVVAPRLRDELAGSIDYRKRVLKAWLYVLAVVALLFAAARPQFGREHTKAARENIDFIIALDLSRSMLAEDMGEWSRLAAAKSAVGALLRQLAPSDRVGLIGFAGQAFVASPVTQDHGALQRALEKLNPNAVALGGSDLAAAIRLAERTFGAGDFETKVLVLVTDGEELQGDAVVAAREAAARGLRVFAVGAGSSSGAPVPESTGRGTLEPLRNEFGSEVITRMNARVLQQIAASGRGIYAPLGMRGEGLARVYAEGLQPIAASMVAKPSREPREYFQWPLGLAIALFMGELLISERRTYRSARP